MVAHSPGCGDGPSSKIELFTTGEYHPITVRFQDKTALNLALELGFTLKADYDDWNTGNGRRIKSWPPIAGELLN